MRAHTDCAIIEFPHARVRPAAALPGGASAAVMIFSGVRIERLDTPPDERPAPRKAGGGDIEFGR